MTATQTPVQPATQVVPFSSRFYFRAAADEADFRAAQIELARGVDVAIESVAAARKAVNAAWMLPHGAGRLTQLAATRNVLRDAQRAEAEARRVYHRGPM